MDITLQLDEIIVLLKDAVHFAVFDSTKGFSHVPLDEASKMLTAMLTPVGIYISNVLAMGLSNATDIFESIIWQILEGLNGTINIADDVLVLGCDHWWIQGVLLACTPQQDQFLSFFAYIFAKKCTHWRLVPPQQVGTPPMGNPGSAPGNYDSFKSNVISFLD